MSFTHSITRRIVTTGRSLEATVTFSGDGEARRDPDVPDETTDMLVEFDLLIADLECIFIRASVDMTLKTNDATTPDETLNLVAGQPYVWHTGSYFANLLATNITKLYVSNASGAAGVLDIEAVFDATP